MSFKYQKEIESYVLDSLPTETEITKVEVEGPEIAVYTRNPRAFFENENHVAKLAYDLKKRINIRADKKTLMEEEKALKEIKRIIPEEAEIKNVNFAIDFSEVIIEAFKPGLVIGKGGTTLKEIVLTTGWTPKILRAPSSPSKILEGIRYHLNKYSSERKKILEEVAKKIYREIPENREWSRITGLGSFREIGRSALLLETAYTKVMLDCGINVAASTREDELPYFDALRFPMNELDATIISHAHLDHSGLLPYLFKLGYRGPVYCTEPTRDLMSLLQFDYIDVLVKEGREPLYTERDVKEMVKYCIPRAYGEVTDIAPDVRMTLNNSAHILGSSSVHLHIGKGAHNLVYTADMKYGFTRLFNNMQIKYPRLETLIIESTYGGKEDIFPQRQDAEDKLVRVIEETLAKGGITLIPVFSVGRAQEVLLVIENYYRRRQGEEIPKIYIDGMVREASAIHTAYPEYLKKGVQRRILQNDSPFTSDIFQEAAPDKRDQIVEEGKCVIIASSGMLTGGPSVEYFNKIADNQKNTIMFIGYQGEGSLGRKVQKGLKEIAVTTNGRTRGLQVNLRVETVEGFSGHSDRMQLSSYIRDLKPKPKKIIVLHGNKVKTGEFAKFLSNRFKINSVAPKNLEAIRLS